MDYYGHLKCLRTYAKPTNGAFVEKPRPGHPTFFDPIWSGNVVARIERTDLRVTGCEGRRTVSLTENGQVAYKVTIKDHREKDLRWTENAYWLYGDDGETLADVVGRSLIKIHNHMPVREDVLEAFLTRLGIEPTGGSKDNVRQREGE